MAHQHLHFKDDIATEHTHGKQIRVSMALLGTLAGGVLLINSGIAKFIWGTSSFNADICVFGFLYQSLANIFW